MTYLVRLSYASVPASTESLALGSGTSAAMLSDPCASRLLADLFLGIVIACGRWLLSGEACSYALGCWWSGGFTQESAPSHHMKTLGHAAG